MLQRGKTKWKGSAFQKNLIQMTYKPKLVSMMTGEKKKLALHPACEGSLQYARKKQGGKKKAF